VSLVGSHHEEQSKKQSHDHFCIFCRENLEDLG
jgi:hypothetical protein